MTVEDLIDKQLAQWDMTTAERYRRAVGLGHWGIATDLIDDKLWQGCGCQYSRSQLLWGLYYELEAEHIRV